MAVLGLRCCARAFSSCGERGPLFIAVCGPLTVAASLVVEHRLQMRRLSSCGSRASLLRGMWGLPRPGLEPVSPALAGRFSTTAPPGKPVPSLLIERISLRTFRHCSSVSWWLQSASFLWAHIRKSELVLLILLSIILQLYRPSCRSLHISSHLRLVPSSWNFLPNSAHGWHHFINQVWPKMSALRGLPLQT